MMRSRAFGVLLSFFVLCGCGSSASKDASPIIAKVGGCNISAAELEEGFATSAFSARPDKLQARRDYLETLVNQKLILLDAQKKGMDKAPDFLNSIERFWAQSLLTVALGQKSVELRRELKVGDGDVRKIYDGMVKEGATTKSFEEVYPQLKWRAEKEMETLRLNEWMEGLRKNTAVSIDEQALKALK